MSATFSNIEADISLATLENASVQPNKNKTIDTLIAEVSFELKNLYIAFFAIFSSKSGKLIRILRKKKKFSRNKEIF